MRARNLRLLSIDDQITQFRRPPEGARIPPARTKGTPPKYIDRIVNSEVVAINGWNAAIAFWLGFDSSMMPDLILSDVLFKDRSSPLDVPGEDHVLPTGLSHFKPFAAIARATGAPIGIAVHTANPDAWKDKIATSDDDVSQILGRLAAHEIGELSAVLGEPIITAKMEPEQKLEACWVWLRANRGADSVNAFSKAMPNFRQRLKNVVIPPAEWIRLEKWCRRMSETPQPLRAQAADGTEVADNADPGLTYILNDGSTQCVSLLSLFADCEHNHKIDLTRTRLPKRCFEIREDESFFLLDEEHLPRIGPLLYACSRFNTEYESAKKLVAHFADIPPVLQLRAFEETGEFGPYAVALAILFKYVEQQHQLLLSWTSAYENFTWLQHEDKFSNIPSETKSLRALVSEVGGIFAANRAETFSSTEVKQQLTHLRAKTIDRCIDILLSINCIERFADGSLQYRAECAGKTPPPPTDFAKNLASSAVVMSDFTRPPRKFLTVAFGYDPGRNDNSIAGKLAKVFDEPGRVAGRKFLARFLDGDAPSHIKTLCRQYALEIGWASEGPWPKALQ